jgi:hypothetical protein
VEPRYRLPIDPLVMLLLAVALLTPFRNWHRASKTPPPVAAP